MRHNESERTLPPKISRVGAAADSVVVVSVVVVVVVEEGVGAAGAAMGATMVGASLEVEGVMAGAPVAAGLIANRSRPGAMSALPSVVAKGSSGRAAGGGVEGLGGVMMKEEREGVMGKGKGD